MLRTTSVPTFKQVIWHLILYFLVIYGTNLCFPRDLWVQDEMRYGEVVREMLAHQQWLVPHLNGHPYPDKPPVYFIIVSALSLLLGSTDWSFHLVTLFSTALAATSTYLFAKQLLGKQAAYWSTLIFCTSLLTLIVGHIIRMDMLLTATVGFSWHALLRYQESKQAKWLRWFWLGCAAGIAVKGPIALLFSLLPAIAWFYWLGQLAKVIQLKLIKGLTLILSLLGLWVVLVLMNGHGEYLSTIWHEQLVGRTVNSWSHREPVYFYLLLLPILLLPWTSVFISGVNSLRLQPNKALHALLFASFVPLAAISLVSGKLFIYLQPLVPATSIIAGYALSQRQLNTTTPLWLGMTPIISYGLFVYLCYCLTKPTLFPQSAALNHDMLDLIALSLTVLITLHLVLIRKPLITWLKTTLLSSAMFSILIFGVATSELNPLFSGKPPAAVITGGNQANAPIGIVNSTRGILNYYLGRKFTELTVGETTNWLQSHPNATLILQDRDLARALPATRVTKQCQYHQTFTVELKQYHVISHCNQH